MVKYTLFILLMKFIVQLDYWHSFEGLDKSYNDINVRIFFFSIFIYNIYNII